MPVTGEENSQETIGAPLSSRSYDYESEVGSTQGNVGEMDGNIGVYRELYYPIV